MSALSKGFRIVQEVVDAGPDGVPFSAVVERTGIAKASAHRLLRELVELSVLNFEASRRRYHGGLLLAGLGARIIADYDLRKAVRHHLVALHEQTGFVATLGILGDGAGIYLDKIEARDFGIRLHSEIGKSFPLHCTAMGKVLLAHSDGKLLRRVAGRKLESHTANTIVRGSELRREVAEVAERGYAMDREEMTRGLMCVAAPVHGPDRQLAGAMSCTFPSYIDGEGGTSAVIRAVQAHAAAASG
jgi:DNA-binding IclR family transcriptional regulator